MKITMPAMAAFAVLPAVALGAAGPSKLDTIVVTPTRSELRLADTLAPIIVIDRQAIVQSQANDLAELLQFNAGLDLGRNGGPGQLSSLFIRGAESNHTLVLIDGVRMNPGTIGGAAIQNIDPEFIERIEVVKGPRSTLYGSEAIGGVINIITRRTDAGPAVAGSIGGGSDATREAALHLATSGRRGRADLGLIVRESDGFPTLRGDNVDRGYDNITLNLNAATEFELAGVELRHWQSSGTTEYSDFFATPVSQDYANRVTALTVASRFADRWQSKLTLSHIVDDIEQNDNPDFITTRRDTLDWQHSYELRPGHQLMGGVYYWKEAATGSVFGSVTDSDIDTTAAFVQSLQQLGRHRIQLAARLSDHEGFGSQTTWNFDYGLRVGERGQMSIGAGSGFRAPDATDRFGFGGNPTLDPEVSRNFELGFGFRLSDTQSLNVQLFDNHIEDLIVFDFDPVTFDGINRNLEETRIRGAEFGYSLAAGPWAVNATAVLQDPKDETTNAALPRRAKRSASANVGYDFATVRLGLNLLASGERKDSGFSETVNAGYVLANVTTSWRLNESLLLTARIENLLDTQYETAAGFRSADRGFHLNLRYNGR